MAVKETLVRMQDTKQTIHSTQTAKIKCPKFVFISNYNVKICFLVAQIVVFKYHNNEHCGKA